MSAVPAYPRPRLPRMPPSPSTRWRRARCAPASACLGFPPLPRPPPLPRQAAKARPWRWWRSAGASSRSCASLLRRSGPSGARARGSSSWPTAPRVRTALRPLRPLRLPCLQGGAGGRGRCCEVAAAAAAGVRARGGGATRCSIATASWQLRCEPGVRCMRRPSPACRRSRAGMKEGGQALLGGLDCMVQRNFFGAQVRQLWCGAGAAARCCRGGALALLKGCRRLSRLEASSSAALPHACILMSLHSRPPPPAMRRSTVSRRSCRRRRASRASATPATASERCSSARRPSPRLGRVRGEPAGGCRSDLPPLLERAPHKHCVSSAVLARTAPHPAD